MLSTYARGAVDRAFVPVARGLSRVGVSANWLTLVGLAGTSVGIGILLAGYPITGGSIAGLACLLDALDGRVARLQGSDGALGAFCDSVTDRVSDAVVLGAAAWLVRAEPALFALAVVVFAAAQLTPYIRAKAEALGYTAEAGLVERPERMLIILIAMGLEVTVVGLWLLAAGSLFTIGQRLWVVTRQAVPR